MRSNGETKLRPLRSMSEDGIKYSQGEAFLEDSHDFELDTLIVSDEGVVNTNRDSSGIKRCSGDGAC